MTCGHINAVWRLNECSGMGGDSNSLMESRAEWKQTWGPCSKALQGLSVVKPEETTTNPQAYLT